MNLNEGKGKTRTMGLQMLTALALWLVIFGGWDARDDGWGMMLGGWLMAWVGLAMMLGAVVAGFTAVRGFFVPPTGFPSVDRSAPEIEDVAVVAYLSILAVCAAFICVRLLLGAI
jgi:hypothetical protein